MMLVMMLMTMMIFFMDIFIIRINDVFHLHRQIISSQYPSVTTCETAAMIMSRQVELCAFYMKIHLYSMTNFLIQIRLLFALYHTYIIFILSSCRHDGGVYC